MSDLHTSRYDVVEFLNKIDFILSEMNKDFLFYYSHVFLFFTFFWKYKYIYFFMYRTCLLSLVNHRKIHVGNA